MFGGKSHAAARAGRGRLPVEKIGMEIAFQSETCRSVLFEIEIPLFLNRNKNRQMSPKRIHPKFLYLGKITLNLSLHDTGELQKQSELP